jgi:myo-inositol-1(or 4)-monophosphatase
VTSSPATTTSLDLLDARGLAALAEEIAHAAGALVGEMVAEAGRPSLRAHAAAKTSATDLATAADRASEALIAARLAAVRPDDGLLGEEGARHPGTTGVAWIVDPIDGTTNFVYGYGSFAVSIAAVVGEIAVAGCVFDPTREETFTAARGCGATRNGEPLAPRVGAPPLAECLIGTGFGYEASDRRRQGAIVSQVLPAVRDIRRGGAAALDLCFVAAGRLDGYYESGLKAWDRAAGVLIARECGLSVTDITPASGPSTLVVATADVIDELVGLLGRAGAGEPHGLAVEVER